MRRTSSIFATLGLLAFAPFVFAQDSGTRSTQTLPAEILGSPLIAWSQLQEPRPVPQPQPLPPPDRPERQPEQPNPNSAQPASSQDQHTQEQPEPSAHTFTGTVMNDGGKFVLVVSDGSSKYQLDDQEKAKRYEGKQVKIAGTLDVERNTVHIVSIELLS